jgi:hypothetical protein
MADNVFTGFIPRKELYRNREQSSLVSRLERSSILHDWKSLREGQGRSSDNSQVTSQMRQQLARVQRKSDSNYGMHPFKIYQFPDNLRRFQNDDDWRRFKVRDGRVLFNGSFTSQVAWGSDLAYTSGSVLQGLTTDTYGLTLGNQVPPSTSAQSTSDGVSSTWNEFTIPADHGTYYVWFSFVLPINGGPWGGLATNTHITGLAFCPAADLTKAKTMFTLETFDATTMWPGIPQDDLYNYLIGTIVVDDGTLNASIPGLPQVIVNQVRNTNIDLIGTVYGTNNGFQINQRFMGTYNGANTYFVGDVVRRAPGDGFTYTFIYDPTVGSAYQPWKVPGPISGVTPVVPEADPWRLLSKF